MSRRTGVAVCVEILALLLSATAAFAITNGQPDGDNHPYVGLMVALDKDGVPLWRCSGPSGCPFVIANAAVADNSKARIATHTATPVRLDMNHSSPTC